jgi:group I intron endonuclease
MHNLVTIQTIDDLQPIENNFLRIDEDDEIITFINEQFHGIVYKIINNINGKIYIGKTKTDFKSYIRNKFRYNLEKSKRPVFRAVLKYGINNFRVKVLEVAYTKEQLNDIERLYIKKLNSQNPKIGYNICSGGEGGPGGPTCKGRKHTEEEKMRMRNRPRSSFATNKGRVFSQEWRENMGKAASLSLKGKPKTPEHRLHLSIARRGISPGNKGKKLVVENGVKHYV